MQYSKSFFSSARFPDFSKYLILSFIASIERLPLFIGLKAIENYLEVQLVEIRNEINALETELKTSDKG